MKSHNLVDGLPHRDILISERPVIDRDGRPVEGLHVVWITLNNPRELNSYTTAMAKEIVLALRAVRFVRPRLVRALGSVRALRPVWALRPVGATRPV